MKRKTIRNHNDFLTQRTDPCVMNLFFTVKIKPAKIPGDARYGIIAPKRVFKLATMRNRAKRIVRDWIAANEDLMLDKYDYVFVLREPILYLPRDKGRRKMQLKLRYLAKHYSQNVTQQS